MISTLRPARGPKAMRYVTVPACRGRSVRASASSLPDGTVPAACLLRAIDAGFQGSEDGSTFDLSGVRIGLADRGPTKQFAHNTPVDR